jgi:hypothetical protein
VGPGGARRLPERSPARGQQLADADGGGAGRAPEGEVHIGLYPLLDAYKRWWLAADFDGPEAMFDP